MTHERLSIASRNLSVTAFASRRFELKASLLLILLLLVPVFARAEIAATSPPEKFFKLVPEKYERKAREFYKKYIDVAGMPVVASGGG
jgi:hypothetical protein